MIRIRDLLYFQGFSCVYLVFSKGFVQNNMGSHDKNWGSHWFSMFFLVFCMALNRGVYEII